jgi:hypothetical protein
MDNERPIEKLLRHYAKKRRADAGERLEMHPATRRLLQGEVARQYPGTRRERYWRASWFSRWKSGLAYAACALAIVAVSVPLLLQSFRKPGPKSELAKAVPANKSVDQTIPAPASATPVIQEADEARRWDDKRQVAVTLTENEQAKDRLSMQLEQENLPAPTRSLASETTSRTAPAVAPPTLRPDSRSQPASLSTMSPASAESTNLEMSRKQGEASPQLAEAKVTSGRDAQAATALDSATAPVGVQPGARSPGPSPTSARTATAALPPTEDRAFRERYGAPGISAPIVVQKFSQTLATTKLRREAASAFDGSSILKTFQLEQVGSRLRVIDSDGSTYSGDIAPVVNGDAYGVATQSRSATVPSPGRPVSAQPVTPPANAVSGLVQNFSFRVTGTNRTLRQPVVFSGNLQFVADASTLGPVNFQQTNAARTQSQLAPMENQLPSLLNSSLSGQVQLGTNKELQLHAVPVPP